MTIIVTSQNINWLVENTPERTEPMIELSRKRQVTTRKNHECFACSQMVAAGEAAIYVRAREDDKPIAFHLHPACHIKAHKMNLYKTTGIKRGVFKNVKSLTNLSMEATVETEYPF